MWSDDAKKEIPASWNSTKMSDAIEGIRTGLNPRDNFKLGSGTIKYITVKNLRSDGILDFSGCDTIFFAERLDCSHSFHAGFCFVQFPTVDRRQRNI